MVIRNILVGVDGSENSDRALDFALDLAEKYNASIMILNVSESLALAAIPEQTIAYTGSNNVIIDKDLRQIHEEILSKSVARAKTAKPNLTISSMLKEGEPALEIVNTANEGGFDVIVIGHRGLSRLKELFLGSISEKVAHLTPCPLIIIK